MKEKTFPCELFLLQTLSINQKVKHMRAAKQRKLTGVFKLTSERK